MEYVASRTLAQVIADDGPLAPEVAAAIGAQVAEALAATHAAGTIHRDVKPGNILVTGDGAAKISDFGIARAHEQEQLTRSGMVIGTPTYFSPELARGEAPTRAGDVWALGATLYAAVEGHPPYEDQANALALLATIATTPPPAPQRADFLAEPIDRMLDPDPGSRWSMADAAHVLHRLHEQYPAPLLREPTTELSRPDGVAPVVAPVPAGAERTAGPEHLPQEPDQPGRRRGAGALVVAALAALLALVAVIGFLLLQGSPTDTTTAKNPGHTPRAAHHTTRAGGSPSSHPTSPAPSTSSTESASSRPHGLGGGSAQGFVERYYASLPSETRTGWSALTTTTPASGRPSQASRSPTPSPPASTPSTSPSPTPGTTAPRTPRCAGSFSSVRTPGT
jgi:serine/threonine protein kinase